MFEFAALIGALCISGLLVAVLASRLQDATRLLADADEELDRIQKARMEALDAGFVEEWALCNRCKGEKVDKSGDKCHRCKGEGRLLFVREKSNTLDLLAKADADMRAMRILHSQEMDAAGEELVKVATLNAELESKVAALQEQAKKSIPSDMMELLSVRDRHVLGALAVPRHIALAVPGSLSRATAEAQAEASRMAAAKMASFVGGHREPGNCVICGLPHGATSCHDAKIQAKAKLYLEGAAVKDRRYIVKNGFTVPSADFFHVRLPEGGQS